jgi:hypothetical protein
MKAESVHFFHEIHKNYLGFCLAVFLPFLSACHRTANDPQHNPSPSVSSIELKGVEAVDSPFFEVNGKTKELSK